jgi:hypothetical protein
MNGGWRADVLPILSIDPKPAPRAVQGKLELQLY